MGAHSPLHESKAKEPYTVQKNNKKVSAHKIKLNLNNRLNSK